MARQIGERVGAILGMDDKRIHLIGYGVYEGEHVPPPEIGGFNSGSPNPKLRMDDGTVVWGCEVWWGSEQKVKEYCERPDLEVVEVDMDKERAKARGLEEEA